LSGKAHTVTRAPLRLYEKTGNLTGVQISNLNPLPTDSRRCFGYNEVSVSNAYKAFDRCPKKYKLHKNVKE